MLATTKGLRAVESSDLCDVDSAKELSQKSLPPKNQTATGYPWPRALANIARLAQPNFMNWWEKYGKVLPFHNPKTASSNGQTRLGLPHFPKKPREIPTKTVFG